MGRPVAFRVAVRPDPIKTSKEVKTESGLIVKIELAVDKKLEEGATQTGTIIGIGPDVYAAFKTKIPFGGLEIGQHVAYAKYSGKWVVDPETEENFLLMNDEDIVYIFKDKDDPITQVAAQSS